MERSQAKLPCLRLEIQQFGTTPGESPQAIGRIAGMIRCKSGAGCRGQVRVRDDGWKTVES